MLTYNILNRSLDLFDFFDDVLNTSRSYFIHAEYPFIRLYEGDDELEIRAELPGIKAEDLDIQLVNNTLTIEGERKSDHLEKDYLREERSFGKFKKSIELPYRVDSEKIHADLKDGVLHIKLLKSEEAKPKKIDVK